LSTAQLIWPVSRKFPELNHFEQTGHSVRALLLRNFRHLEKGIFDVLCRRQHRKQIEGLEDESDITGTQVGELIRGLAGDIIPRHRDAPAVWHVNQADQVE